MNAERRDEIEKRIREINRDLGLSELTELHSGLFPGHPRRLILWTTANILLLLYVGDAVEL